MILNLPSSVDKKLAAINSLAEAAFLRRVGILLTTQLTPIVSEDQVGVVITV